MVGCSSGSSDASGPQTRQPNRPADTKVADAGARIYAGNCVACHQQDARGLGRVYPSLVGSPVLLGDPRELARWVIKGERPLSMPTGRYATMMPQFGWLKAADAAALFTYLRTHFDNSAPPVDAATVAAALGQ
jgi:mono/diheme cytochrome c family protein